MKLLFCGACHDVRKLGGPHNHDHPVTRCTCGKTWGVYTDDIKAVWGSTAPGSHLLGISNPTLAYAIQAQEKIGDLGSGLGRTFEAFVIPDKAPSVKRKEK